MAKFCTGCGAALDDDKKFCTACGASVSDAPETAAPPPPPQAPPQPQVAPVHTQTAGATVPPPAAPQPTYPPTAVGGTDSAPPKGSKYAPITTGGFIGIVLLMCIPILGLLLTIIWACGGCRKITKRNLARASLIMMLVGLIISVILGFAFKSLFGKVVSAIEEESGISITETTGGESGTGGSLNGLGQLLNGLGALTGEESGLEGLLSGAVAANREASKNSNGWPSELPDFPGGTMRQVESYRTEYTETTPEHTKAYIEMLRSNGYQYQDFYDFGMSEADMMEYGGWWGYNGKWYISISHADGVTTIDHVTELPDMNSLFG